MAVETVYRSTLNPEKIMASRKEADAYDEMLETAEHLGALVSHVLPNISEQDAELLSIFMAERRTELAAALKKNPAGIKELISQSESSNVIPLGAAAG